MQCVITLESMAYMLLCVSMRQAIILQPQALGAINVHLQLAVLGVVRWRETIHFAFNCSFHQLSILQILLRPELPQLTITHTLNVNQDIVLNDWCILFVSSSSGKHDDRLCSTIRILCKEWYHLLNIGESCNRTR